MIGGIIGGAIGAAVMESVDAEKEVDYLHDQIEMLAAMKGTISVSHASLLSILMEKTLSAYNLRIDYSESGRKRKIKAILTPPGTLLLQKLSQGKSKKDILREYVEEVSRAFEKALPPEVAQKVQVRI